MEATVSETPTAENRVNDAILESHILRTASNLQNNSVQLQTPGVFQIGGKFALCGDFFFNCTFSTGLNYDTLFILKTIFLHYLI